MFLKRIILHGFKSFADRTEFEFGAGVTAVVGPNGCGKSNVVDAVRWVLGEQSARSLRGDRMADVIFAGSRSRKPAGFAEVQLTFDNRAGLLRSDEDEVTVSRVLYRSGESEYRLNGNACRLRDVRELLMDTGVGVDAYSIIEQGRVDLLLQANPLGRREIFEEAAGISRYKFRRLEAQRKLERTQNNLLRLQDILEELEKRVRSVRLAAGKARNYQQYDARLRELRAAFSIAEYHELEQGRAGIQAQADALLVRLQEGRAQQAERDAASAELEHERQALDEQIQAAEVALLEAQSAASALGERIALGERRLGELRAARDRRCHQAADVCARLATLGERIAAEECALHELTVLVQQSDARIAEAQAIRQSAEQELEELRRRLEHEKVAAFDTVRRGALLQNECENRAQQQSRLRAQAERLAARRQETRREDEELSQHWEQLHGQIAELDQEIDGLSAALRTEEGQSAALRDELVLLDTEIAAARETRTAVASRLALLEDMERRLEGVDEGSRAVLAWRSDDTTQGLVVGLVADLLRIDDPRVPILQSVLSAFENHVVVRDAAAFLAELANRAAAGGPLQVLALDRLTRPATPISYTHAPGFVARASDWVQCAAEFRPLAEHLLGRTFIVESLDQALRLAAEALAGCVFVTLDGATVGADGRMTFGAAGAAPGLISRKAEIRQLRNECDELESQLVQLARRRQEVEAQLSDLQLRVDGLLARIATQQRAHAELRNERARLADVRQRLEREAALTDQELDSVRRSLADLDAQLQALQAERAAADLAQQSHEADMAAVTSRVAEQEAAVARLAQDCTAALVERGRVAEKRAAAEKALEELRARHAASAQEQADAERETAEALAEIERAEGELETARRGQAEQNAACEGCRTVALELRQRRQELLQRLESGGAAARELQRQIEGWEGAWHQQEVALRETEVRKEGLTARVRDELGLDLPALYQTYRHEEQDWEAIRLEIEDLRGRIARLGHVNLDAIAELEELAPRYEHLASQRADLIAASQRLETLIAELDQESRTRFAEAFEQIRAQFQEMFRKLFGGGKADVLLEDPANPLECGIEIIARPPGKEPQSISLLSGGEKTLTTVALLMGVFKSRPSPFAILDEVDAALDEANIERFNSVLQEFLSHSQFVVITHSKRTMACADVLYGVTMEEPGVSKRMSVRFEERVETPIVA